MNHEVVPNLVWPRTLLLPAKDIPIVYLDINHWIGLAQAHSGHPNGSPNIEALRACRRAKAGGKALFVLSNCIYMEMHKIRDPGQRFLLREVMEELTGFATLISRVIVMELELSEAVERIAPLPSSLPTLPLVGHGVFHAFGLQGGFKIRGPEGDATDIVRNRVGSKKFDEYMSEAALGLERSCLGGPADHEVEDLRKYGWQPDSALRIAENRAKQERNYSELLNNNPEWRKQRFRDLISARELIIEFQNILPRVLSARGIGKLSEIVPGPQQARSVVRSMPSTEVAIELKTAWHRNRDKQWIANDIFDIDALALAVPYCDVVVTEKGCHHILTSAKLGERMNTSLLRSLRDLPQALEQRKPQKPPLR